MVTRLVSKMKNFSLLLLWLCCAGVSFPFTSQLMAQAGPMDEDGEEHFIFDGPYVLYRKGEIQIKQIVFKNGKHEVETRSFADGASVEGLRCQLDAVHKKSFDIPLRTSINTPPHQYPKPEKMLVMSDLEGNIHTLILTLQGNGVINDKLEWIYGKGHLAFLGDIFDRGVNVTPCLWLIYKLEQEAEAAGGYVHFILGNHEEMVLRGDNRYTRNKYKEVSHLLNLPLPLLYDHRSELGRWLRSKNTVELVGDILLTHGGISPMVAGANIRLEEINASIRDHLGTEKWRMTERGGTACFLYNELGPMWYRGYFNGHLTEQEVENVVAKYSARHIIVGHTLVPEVSSLHGGRVIAVDVKHQIAIKQGSSNALLLDAGKFYKVNVHGERAPLETLETVFTASQGTQK